MKKRRKWVLILIATAIAGLAYTGYSLFTHSRTDSFTVSEIRVHADSLNGQYTRVEGKVVQGSIDWDSSSETLRFVLADERGSLPVVFQGVAPDEFKPGAELVVEGKYRTDDVFEAIGFSKSSSACSLCH